MCGLLGVYRSKGESKSFSQKGIEALFHRGPDHGGVWSSSDNTISLAHRRLSIIDLSSTANQPMQSASGRYIITFNGEIYNFQSLRKELLESGKTFKSTSDTEVLLESVDLWGVEQTLKKITGMFAFGLWDQKESVLSIARDRIGEKPLWYGWGEGIFAFGSELQALRAMGINPSINPHAICTFLKYGYIPAPMTVFDGFYKLPPASYISLPIQKLNDPKSQISPIPYWDLKDSYQESLKSPYTGSFEEAQVHLEELLNKSVSKTVISDAPIGAFLSGGIDSSLVVSLMKNCVTDRVKTFTIGFNEAEYDEAPIAKKIARHLGTDHTELYLDHTAIKEEIINAYSKYDEPFADSSQIPTLLLSKMTSNYVKVALSGDGGDELFQGYSRYKSYATLCRLCDKTPYSIKKVSNSLLLTATDSSFLPPRLKKRCEGLSTYLSASSKKELYESYLKTSFGLDRLLKKDFKNLISDYSYWPSDKDLKSPSLHDISFYLPNDILVKVDRASMAYSLETRIPLLDPSIVLFALSLPEAYLSNRRRNKLILRSILAKYVPTSMIDRPKMGFGVPIGTWIKGPLKSWAWECVTSRSLVESGYIDPKVAITIFNEHVNNSVNHEYILWPLIILGQWLNTKYLQ